MRPVNDVGGRLHPYQNVPAQDRRHHGHDDGKGKSQPGTVGHIFAHAHIISGTEFMGHGMANPLQTPMQKPMTRKLMEPVEPTAARSSTPRNRPTIMVSTRL